jgi:hypothetical protein
MRTSRLLALALVAVVAGGCGSSTISDTPVPRAAAAQTATLGWVEFAGPPGSRLVFRVRSFSITQDGWRAAVAVTNDTTSTFTVDRGQETPDFGFGVMLFETGSPAELEQRNTRRDLPVLRRATAFAPSLPASFAPHATWTGTASGAGALPGGLWVRFVFGAFKPKGTMPPSLSDEGARDYLIWITDHAHRLRT